MSNPYEELVGPRAEDRNEAVVEDVAENGEPLWMAFLNDPEAITLSKEEVQDAKNAFAIVQNTRPEVISLCKHKTIKECREIVHPAQAA